MSAIKEITLNNGIQIKGPSEEVLKIMELLKIDDGIHYYSATHGKVKIKDMHSVHIKNAVLKQLREWYDNLKNSEPEVLVDKWNDNPSNTVTFQALMRELQKRTND